MDSWRYYMEWIYFAAGIVLGMVILVILVSQAMQRYMIVEYRSNRTFEDTCKAVAETIEQFKDEGWGLPLDEWDAFSVFQLKRRVPGNFRKLHIFFVCNADIASRILSHNRKIVGIMPCSWAIYELEDGTVWLAKMNVGLMSRLFSGVIGSGMKQVSKADEKMLDKVLG